MPTITLTEEDQEILLVLSKTQQLAVIHNLAGIDEPLNKVAQALVNTIKKRESEREKTRARVQKSRDKKRYSNGYGNCYSNGDSNATVTKQEIPPAAPLVPPSPSPPTPPVFSPPYNPPIIPPQQDATAYTNAAPRRHASAVAVYLDKVNPCASQLSIEQLSEYEKELGSEVCIRAIDIALDEKKASWSYIRGILRRLEGAGVKCLADWDKQEATHQAKKQQGGFDKRNPQSSYYGNSPSSDEVKASMSWMDKILEAENYGH